MIDEDDEDDNASDEDTAVEAAGSDGNAASWSVTIPATAPVVEVEIVELYNSATTFEEWAHPSSAEFTKS